MRYDTHRDPYPRNGRSRSDSRSDAGRRIGAHRPAPGRARRAARQRGPYDQHLAAGEPARYRREPHGQCGQAPHREGGEALLQRLDAGGNISATATPRGACRVRMPHEGVVDSRVPAVQHGDYRPLPAVGYRESRVVAVLPFQAVDVPADGRAGRRETPLRRQYEELKRQHPDCVLLFQLGDFFESFEDDARIVARACGVTLTSREFGKGDRVLLAGVPVARLDTFLARLVDTGLHVAVAEQVSPPGSGLVERVITRVVTPGTVVEPGLLRDRENHYLAAVVRAHASLGLAYVDVSTGEFATTQLEGTEAETRLRAELQRLNPAELLVPEGQAIPD